MLRRSFAVLLRAKQAGSRFFQAFLFCTLIWSMQHVWVMVFRGRSQPASGRAKNVSIPSRDVGRAVYALAILFVLTALGSMIGCTPSHRDGAALGATADLLAGRQPKESRMASSPARLTDGTIAVDGDFWRTELTTVLDSPKAYVVYDLGEPLPIGAVYLQGDNDDTYMVSGSEDGETYHVLFEARRAQAAGLRPRFADDLHDRARYIRLSATGGDGHYAVSELQVFSARPEVFPPNLPSKQGTPVYDTLHWKTLLFGAALCLILLIGYRSTSGWVRLAVFLPLLPMAFLVHGLWGILPLPLLEQSLLRAVIAAVALVAIVRELFASHPTGIASRVRTVTLSMLGVLAVGCYYNLFTPQFPHHADQGQTFVHWFDMRVYYPVAKYFDELRFDGLYFASVAAYIEDEPKAADSLAKENIRDLRDHRMRQIGQVRDEIHAIKNRFSPERWESFKNDMRYFRNGMGRRSYVWSLQDHGGNATPVWLLVAKVLFSHTHASDATLIASALLDPLLLGILFVVIGRTFGLRTMLISIIVFGATDFYMFGSDFAGSTLRQDWLVAVGLGACALKRRRWMLGGALLAYGGLIRAFPGMAVVFVAAPALMTVAEHWLRHRRLPTWEAIREEVRPLAWTWLGAACTVVALVGISAAVFPAGTWPAWLHKVHLLSKDAHLNHVGWRTIIMFDPETSFSALSRARSANWQNLQLANYLARRPLYFAGIIAFAVLALLATRKKSLDRAALAGLFFIPVVFYPANYYCHFIFLLVMWSAHLFEERQGKGLDAIRGWGCLLTICILQYWTVQHGSTDLCFLGQSAIVLLGFVIMLGPDAIAGYRSVFAQTPPVSAAGAVTDTASPPPAGTCSEVNPAFAPDRLDNEPPR